MFDDEEDHTGRVLCSSIHKSKGLEASKVFILAKTCRPNAGGDESNIVYVGWTRTIRDLVLIQGDPKVARAEA